MSFMNRPAGEPRKLAPGPCETAPLAPVIEGEQCDRCGAAPRHRVLVSYEAGTGAVRVPAELLFCTHHYSLHEVAIAAGGYRVLP